jgi:hypothetical protein
MAPDNENWGQCPKCGSPVLLDPVTGQPEACSNCTAKKSSVWLYLGGLAVTAGVLGIVYLVYFCITVFVM